MKLQLRKCNLWLVTCLRVRFHYELKSLIANKHTVCTFCMLFVIYKIRTNCSKQQDRTRKFETRTPSVTRDYGYGSLILQLRSLAFFTFAYSAIQLM